MFVVQSIASVAYLMHEALKQNAIRSEHRRCTDGETCNRGTISVI